MDRGAWHGVARVGHDLATKPPTLKALLTGSQEGQPHREARGERRHRAHGRHTDTRTCTGPREVTEGPSREPVLWLKQPLQASALHPQAGVKVSGLKEGDPGGAGPTRGLWLTHIRSILQ